jgi:hypothetical protein
LLCHHPGNALHKTFRCCLWRSQAFVCGRSWWACGANARPIINVDNDLRLASFLEIMSITSCGWCDDVDKSAGSMIPGTVQL